jgi:hypothetical protein
MVYVVLMGRKGTWGGGIIKGGCGEGGRGGILCISQLSVIFLQLSLFIIHIAILITSLHHKRMSLPPSVQCADSNDSAITSDATASKRENLPRSSSTAAVLPRFFLPSLDLSLSFCARSLFLRLRILSTTEALPEVGGGDGDCFADCRAGGGEVSSSDMLSSPKNSQSEYPFGFASFSADIGQTPRVDRRAYMSCVSQQAAKQALEGCLLRAATSSSSWAIRPPLLTAAVHP